MKPLRLSFSGLLALCLGAAPAGAAEAPPPAAAPSAASVTLPAKTLKKPVTDEFHGNKVIDDYRWLETFADPAVRAWNDAQNRYSRAVLDQSPALGAIRDRVKELITASSAAYFDLSVRGGVTFSRKFQPPRDQPLLVTLKSPDEPASERVLVDPLKINSAGTTTIEGLAVDTDLRWSLLRRLVVLGEAGGDQIDTEQQLDDTAAGRLNAAACRAAVPTTEAKAAAWDSCLHDTSLPNHMLGAIIGGITVPDHREFLRPHVEQYFESLPEIWRDRTHEIAQEITLGLYPHSLVETATVERTDAVLDGTVDIPHGARRLLGEGRDGVLRSLRCQQRDGA